MSSIAKQYNNCLFWINTSGLIAVDATQNKGEEQIMSQTISWYCDLAWAQ